MKAVAVTRYLPLDDPDSLIDADLPKPEPTGRDLLVAVKAVAVNPLDLRVRTPKDRIEPTPRVLGWDAAGIVEAVGPDVTMFRPGDAVYYAGDISRPGSYAEYQLVDERIVGPMPMTASFEEAAAMPLTALTAWEALFDRLRIPPVPKRSANKSILVIGAAGGVGSMAVQLASRHAGLTVIGTASRPESARWVQELGARHVIDHYGDMPAQLKSLGFDYVDYVLIAADFDRHFSAAVQAVAPQGSICNVVEARQPFDTGLLWDKSVSLAWQMVFTRLDYRTADLGLQGQALRDMARLVDQGVLKSTLTKILAPINAANVREANASLARGQVIGKIALKGFQESPETD